MDDNRREFLKKAGFVFVGAGLSLPLIGATAKMLRASSGEEAAPMTKQWGMVIDIDKCQDQNIVKACVEACHFEHNVPHIPNPEEEVKWIWTESFKNVFSDQVHKRSTKNLKDKNVLVMCNHCQSPSCVKVCPTQATWKRKEDGIVMMDMHRCIGCRYCMAACPYGARSFNFSDPRKYLDMKKTTDYPTRTKGVVDKCTFCAERIRYGKQPACVEAADKVPGGKGALVFGDISDPHSEVSKILAVRDTIVRRPELGTSPNVYYLI